MLELVLTCTLYLHIYLLYTIISILTHLYHQIRRISRRLGRRKGDLIEDGCVRGVSYRDQDGHWHLAYMRSDLEIVLPRKPLRSSPSTHDTDSVVWHE